MRQRIRGKATRWLHPLPQLARPAPVLTGLLRTRPICTDWQNEVADLSGGTVSIGRTRMQQHTVAKNPVNSRSLWNLSRTGRDRFAALPFLHSEGAHQVDDPYTAREAPGAAQRSSSRRNMGIGLAARRMRTKSSVAQSSASETMPTQRFMETGGKAATLATGRRFVPAAWQLAPNVWGMDGRDDRGTGPAARRSECVAHPRRSRR